MIRNKRSFFSENLYVFLAFCSAAIAMLAVYLCNGIIPFGDKTVLRMDLYHQYGPLFAELYDTVKGEGNFFYSWKSGLGSCFLGNYFNYLSSPIGAIIMFFGHKNIPEAIGAMVLIKAALSSATFTWYIKRSLRNQSIVTVSFGMLYAFCGYMLAYYWNIMWLDAMVLLPIVLLGIERIINHGKPMTYIIGLSLTMFSNYYMAYMICIFAVLYFFYYHFIRNGTTDRLSKAYADKHGFAFKNSRFFRSGVIFAFASIAAAGIMAFALLPVANVLTTSSATSGTFPKDAQTYFKFFDFLANHLTNLTTTIRSSGTDVLPNVYCGILTIVLAPLYFFTKSISKKEKIATIILLAALYFSFNINTLNYIWHGFHFPNDLPYRQSFIYSFILLIMAYKTFLRLGEFTSRQIGAAGAALLAFIVLVEKLTSKNVGDGTIVYSAVFIILYVLVLTIFKDKRYDKSLLVLILLLFTATEVVLCDTVPINITVDKTPYVSDYDEFNELKDNLDIIEDGDFYRMELTNLRTRMDPSWYGYNGVSVFSSMADKNVSRLQKNLGMMSNAINSYTYNPQTPVYNMMHSLKYIVNNDIFNVLNSPYYTPSIQTAKFHAYKNNYYLPIGYCVNSETEFWGSEVYINEWKAADSSNPFKLQSDYVRLATGVNGVFEKLEIASANYSNVKPFPDLTQNVFSFTKTTADAAANVVFYIQTKEESNVYVYFETTGHNGANVTINSTLGTTTQSTSQNCILDLGNYKSGEMISVTVPFEANSGTFKFYAYTVNNEKLDRSYQILKKNQMIVEVFEGTNIEGKFTAKEDCLFYTSIPYDEGWSVYLDGEKVSEDDIVSLGSSYLCLRVNKGNHSIRFSYESPGFTSGIVMSIMTLLIILIIYLRKRSKAKRGIASKLPAFNPINDYFTETIIYPQPKRRPVSVNEKKADNEAPVRISPKKEVFYPESIPERETINPPEIIKAKIKEEE